jgi:putative flippase GtrA
VVGAIAYVIDLGVFNAFYGPTNIYIAQVISGSIATTAAFFGNRHWTWRHRMRAHIGREYALYFAFNVVGMLIALACAFVSDAILGHYWPEVFRTQLAANIATKGFGVALGTLFRFWSYRRFVFIATRAESAVVTQDA